MKYKRGFTLIELMVVVAIIALLTSVVSALIGDAREKAAAQGFRQEIDQLVKAIELYRADHNGRTPGPSTLPLEYAKNQLGAVSGTSGFDLENILASGDYIQAVPKPPFTGEMRFVRSNAYRCQGDATVSEYQIWVSGPKNIAHFSDWPILVDGSIEYPDYKCFSIK